MEKRLEMTIEPRPKERPRAKVIKTKSGSYIAQIYTPSTTEDYEKKIRSEWIKACGEDVFTGPVVVRIHFRMPIPKSTTKAKRAEMLARKIRPTVKPDIDNLAKSVLDALNGVAYKDDSQIVTTLVKKYYAEIPGVKVIISEWKEEEE